MIWCACAEQLPTTCQLPPVGTHSPAWLGRWAAFNTVLFRATRCDPCLALPPLRHLPHAPACLLACREHRQRAQAPRRSGAAACQGHRAPAAAAGEGGRALDTSWVERLPPQVGPPSPPGHLPRAGGFSTGPLSPAARNVLKPSALPGHDPGPLPLSLLPWGRAAAPWPAAALQLVAGGCAASAWPSGAVLPGRWSMCRGSSSSSSALL